jgi:hypothetical protein
LRNQSRLFRAAPILALLALLTLPAGVLAVDGEIGDLGNRNSITELYVTADGRPITHIVYPHDCPAGISVCWIETQFRYKCPEFWCFTVNSQPWKFLPANGFALGDCIGNDDNYWEVWYRIGYAATGTKTVTYSGEVEFYLNAKGSFTYKNIAEAELNVTDKTGTRGSVTLETVTAGSDVMDPVLVTTSGGRTFHTC